MMNETKTFKIYRNGQFDLISTYSPMVKDKMMAICDKIDYFFEKSL